MPNVSPDMVRTRPPKLPPIAAITISDLHLTLSPPSCRLEKDWLNVMVGYFDQVNHLHDRVSIGSVPVPIICAGDVFDRPNPPVELVNWAIRTLPKMFSIPGQHDLNNHRYADIKKSAYWTLVECGTLIDLAPDKAVSVGNVRMHGFPWGCDITPCSDNHGLALELAIIHKYIWTKGKSYPNAPKEARATCLQDALQGYDIAIVGDNHKPFDLPHSDLTSVVNCGSFLRRKRDEIDHSPSVVLIHQNGEFSRHYLDVSGDQFTLEEEKRPNKEVGEFVSSLNSLDNNKVDFRELLMRTALTTRMEVGQVIREVLEEAK